MTTSEENRVARMKRRFRNSFSKIRYLRRFKDFISGNIDEIDSELRKGDMYSSKKFFFSRMYSLNPIEATKIIEAIINEKIKGDTIHHEVGIQPDCVEFLIMISVWIKKEETEEI